MTVDRDTMTSAIEALQKLPAKVRSILLEGLPFVLVPDAAAVLPPLYVWSEGSGERTMILAKTGWAPKGAALEQLQAALKPYGFTWDKGTKAKKGRLAWIASGADVVSAFAALESYKNLSGCATVTSCRNEAEATARAETARGDAAETLDPSHLVAVYRRTPETASDVVKATASAAEIEAAAAAIARL